jgi:sugar phosphate isomerase/epimerase
MIIASSRRDFLRIASLASAAGCVLRFSNVAQGETAHRMIYGVQLYMIRRQAQQNFAGILKAIRAIGYRQIELYAMAYNYPVTELRRMIEDAGLGVVSGHFDYSDFEPKIEYAHQLGLKYMVCPMIPREQWDSLDGFRKAADNFNRWAPKIQQAGMQFAFHNHNYEFKPQEGSCGFDELIKRTDPKLVKLEMDVYWVIQGGRDPLEFLKQHKDRIQLFHMKDRLPGAATGYLLDESAQHFTELGQGAIPWRALLKQAHSQGIRYAFVDQDETAGPVLDSLKVSYEYLKRS